MEDGNRQPQRRLQADDAEGGAVKLPVPLESLANTPGAATCNAKFFEAV
jgi:hypothetical protein